MREERERVRERVRERESEREREREREGGRERDERSLRGPVDCGKSSKQQSKQIKQYSLTFLAFIRRLFHCLGQVASE